MRGRFHRYLVAAALLCAAPAVHAETLARQWQITPFGGYALFDESSDSPGILASQFKDAAYYGGRLGYQFTQGVGIELAGGFSPTQVDAAGGQDVDFLHVGGDFIVSSPIGSSDVFLLGGGAFSSVKPNAGDQSDQATFEIGTGLRWWWSDRLGLRLEARQVMLLGKDSGFLDSKNSATVLGAGLMFGIGGQPPDEDGDGVRDRLDKCPGTPKGASVDATGCPTDADGDGVFDGIDQCANTPKGGMVDAKGCPVDGDGDGVPDGLDQCADTPKGAMVDARGCPADGDGDGVFDGIDQCPGTAKGATVDARGCPSDSDGDGVPDGLDRCPGTAAGVRVDAEGCPIEVTEKETELLDTGMIRLEDVNFETGKSTLVPESYGTLDDVGTILVKWPALKIEIGGHTDSRGSVASNQALSEARARAVHDYLLQKFASLGTDQFTVKGYGESKPLVPNNSALNMAKNRRVEFKVLNRDVLKREIERRRTLPK